ncbi:hypothetical protein DAPPUDRAFT_230004, partial [Daphnia pulex]
SAQNIRSDTFVCPKENGFFAHDISCDKYWKCVEGVATLELCGNGLAFDDTDLKNQRENCDYIYNVECGDRLEVEAPISTRNCPSLHGVFPDETKCDVFWSCWNGEASRYQCAPGLAYSRESRVADYYGTLDLDGLRNTEVQAGLAPEAAPVKVAPKKPVTSRPAFRPRPVTEVLVVEEESLTAV